MKVDKVDITILHSMMRKFYGNEFLGISTDGVLFKRGTLLWNGEWKPKRELLRKCECGHGKPTVFAHHAFETFSFSCPNCHLSTYEYAKIEDARIAWNNKEFREHMPL